MLNQKCSSCLGGVPGGGGLLSRRVSLGLCVILCIFENIFKSMKMKKCLFLITVCATFSLTNCKRNAPVPTNNINNTTNTPSSYLIVNGANENISSTSQYIAAPNYSAYGLTNSTYSVTISFNNGEPTGSATYFLWATAITGGTGLANYTYPTVAISDNNSNVWRASSGTLNVKVYGHYTNYSFNNIVLTPFPFATGPTGQQSSIEASCSFNITF